MKERIPTRPAAEISPEQLELTKKLYELVKNLSKTQQRK